MRLLKRCPEGNDSLKIIIANIIFFIKLFPKGFASYTVFFMAFLYNILNANHEGLIGFVFFLNIIPYQFFIYYITFSFVCWKIVFFKKINFEKVNSRKVNYFPIFDSVMKNKLENTFQCLVMSWKMSCVLFSQVY
jgi:hypothetical protein